MKFSTKVIITIVAVLGGVITTSAQMRTAYFMEGSYFRTDMNAALDEQTLAELCDETPLCRLGEPEDVAELAYFLASDKASFITGQIIGVDGGFAV